MAHSAVQHSPLNWKVECSIRGQWVNCRSAPWVRAFTSTAPARRKFQASACRQLLPSPNMKQHGYDVVLGCALFVSLYHSGEACKTLIFKCTDAATIDLIITSVRSYERKTRWQEAAAIRSERVPDNTHGNDVTGLVGAGHGHVVEAPEGFAQDRIVRLLCHGAVPARREGAQVESGAGDHPFFRRALVSDSATQRSVSGRLARKAASAPRDKHVQLATNSSRVWKPASVSHPQLKASKH